MVRRIALVLAVLITALVVPSAAGAEEPPGTIVSAQPMTAQLIPGVRIRAKAWRILYRSTGATGAPQVVSGTVLVPEDPWTGPGPRPLVGYALGTPGLADHCAPSRQLANGTQYEASVVNSALGRGWALALTDYPGLGTPGDHQYVVGRSLGRAVLDSMRAARDLPGAGVDPAAPLAIYGYSEGGEAAGWALQLQPAYAPELDVRGGAVGAAPVDFPREAEFIDGRPFSFLLGYVATGFAAAYPELRPALDAALTPLGRRYETMLRGTCIIDAIVLSQFWPHDARSYLRVPPLEVPGLRQRLEENNLGTIAPAVPVVVGANRFDEVMVYETSGPGLRDDWCARGGNVTFAPSFLADHLSGVFDFWPVAGRFLDARLRGAPAPRPADCTG